jgi:hypothetical protein
MCACPADAFYPESEDDVLDDALVSASDDPHDELAVVLLLFLVVTDTSGSTRCLDGIMSVTHKLDLQFSTRTLMVDKR